MSLKSLGRCDGLTKIIVARRQPLEYVERPNAYRFCSLDRASQHIELFNKPPQSRLVNHQKEYGVPICVEKPILNRNINSGKLVHQDLFQRVLAAIAVIQMQEELSSFYQFSKG
jgi:hypothetical protein